MTAVQPIARAATSAADKPSLIGMSRERLAAALQANGIPEVDISSRRRAEYSSDASLYRVVPRAVVFPRSPDEIIASHAVARDLGVPIVARGAGTSIAGNAVGPGVVVDTVRHLNRVRSIDPESGTAEVEPGVPVPGSGGRRPVPGSGRG